jgi:hypothetical protein
MVDAKYRLTIAAVKAKLVENAANLARLQGIGLAGGGAMSGSPPWLLVLPKRMVVQIRKSPVRMGEAFVRKDLIAIVFIASCPLLVAQQTLSNDNILNMTKAGFSEESILTAISRSPGNDDTSVDGLIALKNAGVTNNVFSAVVSKASVVTPPRVGQARALAPVVAQQTSSPSSRRLYVEERIKTTSGTSVHCDSYGCLYQIAITHVTRQQSLELHLRLLACPWLGHILRWPLEG